MPRYSASIHKRFLWTTFLCCQSLEAHGTHHYLMHHQVRVSLYCKGECRAELCQYVGIPVCTCLLSPCSQKHDQLLYIRCPLCSVYAGLFTLKQVVSCPLPLLEARLSPRSSNSKTAPSAARTFTDICPWPEFLIEAGQLEESLNDTRHVYNKVCHTHTPGLGISLAADECEVRGTLVAVLQSINDAARILNIGAECVGGGSGRSLSFTDLVVRKSGQSSNPQHLSALVLGVGEVKGAWQLDLQDGDKLEDMLRDPVRIETCVMALQQASHVGFDAITSDVGQSLCTCLVCAQTQLLLGWHESLQITPAHLKGLGMVVHGTFLRLSWAGCFCYGQIAPTLQVLACLQAYGDAVINEAPVLFVSNYHCTVFLKRNQHVHNKKLWASEPIWWDRQHPSARSCWLRFLRAADEMQDIKPRLPRMVVPRTADGCILPQVKMVDASLVAKRGLRPRPQPTIRLMASSINWKGYRLSHKPTGNGTSATGLQQQLAGTTAGDSCDMCTFGPQHIEHATPCKLFTTINHQSCTRQASVLFSRHVKSKQHAVRFGDT